MKQGLIGMLAGTMLAIPGTAAATLIFYEADLQTLNGSGVTGTVTLVHDDAANVLTVRIQATGLEPDQIHPQHIHGRFDGIDDPIDSTVPTPTLDSDGDGFIEVVEGVPAYGPVILSLRPFTTAPGGIIDFEAAYDLATTPDFNAGRSMNDLLPLDLRVVVLHGMSVEIGVGSATMIGEVDGTGGFKAPLPVAAGEFVRHAIPEPATLALFGAGLLVLVLRRRLV